MSARKVTGAAVCDAVVITLDVLGQFAAAAVVWVGFRLANRTDPNELGEGND